MPQRRQSSNSPAPPLESVVTRACHLIEEWERFEQSLKSAAEFAGDMPREDAAPIFAQVRRLRRLGVRFDPDFLADLRAAEASGINGDDDSDSDDSDWFLNLDEDDLEYDDPDLDLSDEGLDFEDLSIIEVDPNIDERGMADDERIECGPSVDIACREAIQPEIDLHTRRQKSPKPPRPQPADRSGHKKQRCNDPACAVPKDASPRDAAAAVVGRLSELRDRRKQHVKVKYRTSIASLGKETDRMQQELDRSIRPLALPRKYRGEK